MRRSLLAAVTAALIVLPGVAAPQEPPACGGRDLVAELAASDAGRYAAIRAEADRIPNGKGILWKIEKAGLPPSYLVGTVHVTDPRSGPPPEAALAAIREARVLLVENVEAIEGDAAKVLGPVLADRAVLKDGRSLDDILGEAGTETVRQAMKHYGVPYAAVRGLKPWFVSVMLALPACEAQRTRARLPTIDGRLVAAARAADVPVEGLETIAEQLDAMATIDEAAQRDLLIETARIIDHVEDGFATLMALYKARDIAMILPFYTDLVRAETGAVADVAWADFQTRLLDRRNQVMIERALPHLAEGDAVIAVGALHLVGEAGLVELLRAAGYTVTRID